MSENAFEIVIEEDTGREHVQRTNDECAIDAEVVNLVMEVMRLNPEWAKHWLELGNYMVFQSVEWGEA